MLGLPGNSGCRVVVCPKCDLRFLDPYLDEAALQDLYSKAYFNSTTEVGGNVADYEGDYVKARLTKFRRSIREMLKGNPGAKNILDVGAATGDFVWEAKQLGLDASGCELSAYGVQRAFEKYGIRLLHTRLEEIAPEKPFDLIHLNHVFEHLSAPLNALRRLHDLLGENGLLYIEVPFQFNIVEVVKFMLQGKSAAFGPFSLHHPIFYTPSVLRCMLEENGFRCRAVRVFDEPRYLEALGASTRKAIFWRFMACLRQGNIIEIVAKKAPMIQHVC